MLENNARSTDTILNQNEAFIIRSNIDSTMDDSASESLRQRRSPKQGCDPTPIIIGAAAGGATGAIPGAAAGAAIGSVVPVVGTVIGGVIGFIAGAAFTGGIVGAFCN